MVRNSRAGYKVLCLGAVAAYLSLTGCKTDGVDRSLGLSGDNRSEIQAFLDRYPASADLEMHDASRWIVANMAWHFSSDTASAKRRKQMYREYSSVDQPSDRFIDSLKRVYPDIGRAGADRLYDLEHVSQEFLTDDLESAFFARRRWPWAAGIPFEMFCRYVLPYRVADEPISLGWRRAIQARYLRQIDSVAALPGMDNPLMAANALLHVLDIDRFKWVFRLSDGQRLGPEIVDIAVGTCQDRADFITYFLRAAGIPCGTDKVLIRGEGNTPHSWAFVLDDEGETFIKRTPDFQPTDSLDVAFIKIHRERFDLNHEIETEIHKEKNVLDFTRLISLLHMDDVTREYAGATELTIPVDSLIRTMQGSRQWLCASSWRKWVPISPAIVEEDSVYLGFVGPGRVANIGEYTGDGLTTLSFPFFTSQYSEPRFIKPSTEKTEAVLYRKYTPHIGEFADRMVGGIVEASDNSSFCPSETLLVISEEPQRLFTRKRVDGHPHRYVRYRGADGSYCDVSELCFYTSDNDTVPLEGTVVGSVPLEGHDLSHTYVNAFDGDPYTSFSFGEPDGGWTGMKFSRPEAVRSVEYTPRNRDNFVRRGDVYELFTWNPAENSWESLGHQKAMADSLVYTVPRNALMYLRNHSRGKDERIFLYDRVLRRQVFY